MKIVPVFSKLIIKKSLIFFKIQIKIPLNLQILQFFWSLKYLNYKIIKMVRFKRLLLILFESPSRLYPFQNYKNFDLLFNYLV